MRSCIIQIFFAVGLVSSVLDANDIRYIRPSADRGVSEAVVVGDVPLAHTAQLLPVDESGKVLGEDDVAAQTIQVLANLERLLTTINSDLNQLVKLNAYVADEDSVPMVERVLAKRFAMDRKPAVSFVVSPLADPKARVAMDAVAIAKGNVERSVKLHRSEGFRVGSGASISTMPAGTRIYVAGQAEKAGSLTEATRLTLESLSNTLRFLGRRDADIVQLKAFLSPMSEANTVQAEIAKFFGQEKLPPIVFVQWNAPLIEIELIAWGGEHNSGPVVEYLTPPNMKASPVFSRIARINSAPSIYTSGLFATTATDAAEETKEIYLQLGGLLRDAGSDFAHLTKATYYCSTDSASQKLNELRPNYYDPARPPSASKAMVSGVGRPGRGLTLDMIGVPAWDNATAEYGPVEHGHGLLAADAEAGWLSLFDGDSIFGWKDARVDVQGLFGGTTTAEFGACKVRVEVAQAGWIKKGTTTFEVKGTQEIEFSDTAGPIQLSDAVRVKSLRIQPTGLQSIFNGADLTGWKRIDRETIPQDQRPEWNVSNQTIHARKGPGALEYVTEQYSDFVLQLEAKSVIRHSNAGVFFRAIPDDFMNGYEAQIYNRGLDGDASRPARYSTGAIDDHQLARRLVSRDGEFFTLTILARGPHIATWVNGAPMADWTDTRPSHENPRQGLRISAGAIQLQAHDPGTAVDFRNIRIRELSSK